MFYFAVLIGEHLRGFARNLFQIFEYINAFIHFLYGIGAEQVEIDGVEFQVVLTVVAPGPFLGITHCTYAAQVHAGNEVTLCAIFDEIRERQVSRVGV